MLGHTGRVPQARDADNILPGRRRRRSRRDRIQRRQKIVELEEEEVSEAEGEISDHDEESDSEPDHVEDRPAASKAGPGHPALTQAPAIGESAAERVIPTLTPISHSPRPIPPIVASPQKGEEDNRDDDISLTRPGTTLATSTIAASGSPGAGLGAQPTATREYPSVSTSGGAKGLLESSGRPVADTDDISVVDTSAGNGGLSSGAKAGIAVGTIAGVALLGGLLFFLYRFYMSYVDRKRDRAAAAANAESYYQRTTNGNNINPGGANTSATIDPRSNSQILDELIAASYAHQNGGGLPDDSGLADEKRELRPGAALHIENIPRSRNQPLEPEPQLRGSIASWLRRHHPLKLNDPHKNRASLTSSVSSASKVSAAASEVQDSNPPGSRFHLSLHPDQSVSNRNTMATNVTNSVYDYYARPESNMPPQPHDVVPPLPPAYQPPKTQQLAAKYQSVWSESTTTSGGATNATTTSSAYTSAIGQGGQVVNVGLGLDVSQSPGQSAFSGGSGSAGSANTSILFMYAQQGQQQQVPPSAVSPGLGLNTNVEGKQQDGPLPVSPLSPLGDGSAGGLPFRG